MKILILRNPRNESRFLKTLNAHPAFEIDCYNVNNEDEALNIVNLNASTETKAVIVDRIYFRLANLKNIKQKFDWFFIVESLNKAQIYGEVDFDMRYRFYLWPLNENLLMDDIKSLTFLREYMTLGEIQLGQIHINLANRTVSDGRRSIFLKNKEYELLLYLAKNKGKLLSRNNILENVWDMNSQVLTNTVDVHVSKLRRKLKDNFGLDSLVKTIPCSGYILL